jgi:hypothetical protein
LLILRSSNGIKLAPLLAITRGEMMKLFMVFLLTASLSSFAQERRIDLSPGQVSEPSVTEKVVSFVTKFKTEVVNSFNSIILRENDLVAEKIAVNDSEEFKALLEQSNTALKKQQEKSKVNHE